MICNTCEKDMAQCTCDDLEERFRELQRSEHLRIGIEYQARILAHIEARRKQRERDLNRGATNVTPS